jgi:hypothetical protein
MQMTINFNAVKTFLAFRKVYIFIEVVALKIKVHPFNKIINWIWFDGI